MAEEHGASPESNTFEERDAVREGQQPGDSMQPGTRAAAGPREQ